ncbi:MAG: hypothetical protein ACLUFH_00650 [Monoglobales bacterium]
MENRSRSKSLGLIILLMVLICRRAYAETTVNTEVQLNLDEAYTNTDSRRGILAVRCNTFQGFSGEVTVQLKGAESEKSYRITLTEESGYMENRELIPQLYQIESVKADSEGRSFDCKADLEEFVIETDQIEVLKIRVEPGSVYRVPWGEESSAIAAQEVNQKLENIQVEESDIQSESQEHTNPPVLAVLAILSFVGSVAGIVWIVRNRDEA